MSSGKSSRQNKRKSEKSSAWNGPGRLGNRSAGISARRQANLLSTALNAASSNGRKFIFFATQRSRQYGVISASNKTASASSRITSGMMSQGASPSSSLPPQDSMVAAETDEASSMRYEANPAMLTPSSCPVAR